MAALLYYLEGYAAPVTSVDRLAELGLAYAFDRVPYNAKRPGPTKGVGTLLCDDAALAPYEPAYREGEQTWKRVPDKYRPGLPPLWIGLYDAAPRPTSWDLKRPALIDGDDVQLADGATPWRAPRVRSVNVAGGEFSPLPSYVTLDASGKPRRGDIREQYRRLWDASTPFWDAFVAAWNSVGPDQTTFTVPISDEALYDAAAAMLAANYRVGPVECDLLRLFATDGQLGDVMWAACDCDRAIAFLQKKTTSPTDDSSSTPGSPAG